MPIQNTDYWVDDTLDDSNFTSGRKPKYPRHYELYMSEGD